MSDKSLRTESQAAGFSVKARSISRREPFVRSSTSWTFLDRASLLSNGTPTENFTVLLHDLERSQQHLHQGRRP